MKYSIYALTHTDKFGGEANYSWVKRQTLITSETSRNKVVREAKALLGLTGERFTRSELGFDIRLDKPLQVVFIDAVEFSESYFPSGATHWHPKTNRYHKLDDTVVYKWLNQHWEKTGIALSYLNEMVELNETNFS